MRTISVMTTVLVMLVSLAAARGEDSSGAKPVAIDATDKAALAGAIGRDVVVTGTIKSAAWSASGKVMNVEFAESELLAAVFERSKEAMNKAFGGDAARAWTGAKVTVSGKLEKYGGRSKRLEGRPQIVISSVEQVKVVGTVAGASPGEGAKKP